MRLYFFLSLAIGHNRRRIGSIRVRSTRSAHFSYPLQTLFCKCVCFLSLSPSDFWLVGSVFAKTDRVHPFPTDSIRRLFLPSAYIILVMRLFSKSLAIGLPASQVGIRKDGSCPSVSDRLDPSAFPTLCKDITLVIIRLFSKSLAIGLPASRVGAYLRRSDSVRVYWTTF